MGTLKIKMCSKFLKNAITIINYPNFVAGLLETEFKFHCVMDFKPMGHSKSKTWFLKDLCQNLDNL